MSKPNSGLFRGTIGSKHYRLVPGEDGKATGGDSTKLGKNLLTSMGLKRSLKWGGYQAQHIIPAELIDHPVLQKIGIDLDHHTNGIFLRTPSSEVSTLTRHFGYHAPYNKFVRSQLDKLDINASSYELQREVKKLQSNLRKMQISGAVIYPKYGATVETITRAYNRAVKL